jgi:hypothetical protein
MGLNGICIVASDGRRIETFVSQLKEGATFLSVGFEDGSDGLIYSYIKVFTLTSQFRGF